MVQVALFASPRLRALIITLWVSYPLQRQPFLPSSVSETGDTGREGSMTSPIRPNGWMEVLYLACTAIETPRPTLSIRLALIWVCAVYDTSAVCQPEDVSLQWLFGRSLSAAQLTIEVIAVVQSAHYFATLRQPRSLLSDQLEEPVFHAIARPHVLMYSNHI